ncbi:5-(carboxyamino)imidazole ribonucleotide synthase [Fructilactobacillus vespulae]|uniref:5-(carboxyamino)imidazole ribonucleotide synthase n=1 Tax=Fructilactobacillus vespulae TaxID=1249630 RepID=UPI0039B49A25
MKKVVLPPATIGIIGGGQLGRMMAEAAKPMGYRVVILDPNPDSSAGKVSDEQIVAAYDDIAALTKLADEADVITYEFENVDVSGIEQVKENSYLAQDLDNLRITSNRILEKEFLEANQIKVAPFRAVKVQADLEPAISDLGYPAILKTVSGGYDGHGQWNLNNDDDLQSFLEKHQIDSDHPLILERKLNFDCELSMMVTRDGNDRVVTWPISRNYHQDHILKISIIQDDLDSEITKQAQTMATKIAQKLNLKGMLGIEFFLQGNQLLVNELAPRPHNSGHYTIEGTNVSQFEGQIRSVTGLPIAEITLNNQQITMINLLGSEITSAREDLVNHPEWHFHDYEKTPIVKKRKMGHITVLGKANGAKLIEWEKSHHDQAN